MLIAGIPTRVEEVAAEDLHVARQHEQLGAAARAARASPPRPAPCAPCSTGHVVEGHARTRRVSCSRSAVVGDHARRSPRRARRDASATAGPAGSGRGARRGSRCRRRSPQQRSSPVHLEAAGDLCVEALLEGARARAAPRGRTPCAGRTGRRSGSDRVLVRGDDVGSALEQKARDGGDDPGPVRHRAISRRAV